MNDYYNITEQDISTYIEEKTNKKVVRIVSVQPKMKQVSSNENILYVEYEYFDKTYIYIDIVKRTAVIDLKALIEINRDKKLNKLL